MPRPSSEMPAYSLYLDLGSQLKKDGLLAQSKWTRLQRAWLWGGLLDAKVPAWCAKREWLNPLFLDYMHTLCPWMANRVMAIVSWAPDSQITTTVLRSSSRWFLTHISFEPLDKEKLRSAVLWPRASTLTGATVGSGPSSCWLCSVWSGGPGVHGVSEMWFIAGLGKNKREETTFASGVTIQVP